MIDFEKIETQKISCSVDTEKRTITISGEDTPGILAHMVGSISLQSLNIEKAKSHRIKKEDKVYFKNIFYISLSQDMKESWDTDIPDLVEKHIKPIYDKKNSIAQQNIIENFVNHISANKEKYNKQPVVDIEIDEGEQLKITVRGEDAPFLLYMITTALEYQKLSILDFTITTRKSFIEDVFYVEKPVGFGESDIKKLQLSLLLSIHYLFFLQKSPDPYEGFLRLQDIIKKISAEEKTAYSLLFSGADQKEHLLTFLGLGDSLWEDFIRTQSNEITELISLDEKAVFENVDIQAQEQQLKYQISRLSSYKEKIRVLNECKDNLTFNADIYNIFRERQDVRRLGKHLSEIAKIILREVAMLVEQKLNAQYGIPKTSISHVSEWVLFGLGKLGGEALGYASDIELMVIYEDKGKTDGKEQISNRDYYDEFVRELNNAILAKRVGIFKIDLRLRPHGVDGPLAVRLNNFIQYYQSEQAHSVEKLALTRMRPLAGSPRLAERVLRITKSFLYQENAIKTNDVFEFRKKQLAEKVKTPQTRNAKFSLGALADVEYAVQMLQVKFGKHNISLQQPSIHSSLYALQSIGEISREETDFLVDAYIFFRRLINALRIRRGNAHDITLPEEGSWELEHLAKRMGYEYRELTAGETLLFDFDRYTAGVNVFLDTHFKEEASMLEKEVSNPARIVFLEKSDKAKKLLSHFENPEQVFFLIKKCGNTEKTRDIFSQLLLLAWVRIKRCGNADFVILMIESMVSNMTEEETTRFYKKLLKQPKRLSVLIDIFATSRFLSVEIIKNPNYLFSLLDSKNIEKEKSLRDYQEDINRFVTEENPQTKKARKNCLRDFRKQEILRIMVRDVCVGAPLKHICREISFLAQAIIQKSLEFALKDSSESQDETRREHSGENSDVAIDPRGIVIFAFGKLGSGELNYSSDVDLMCVYDETCGLPSQDLARVFRDTVAYLAEYTSSGVGYRIDLRLRPFGESGDIITKMSVFEEYYSRHARLWEIQAGLKISMVAGDKGLAQKCYAILSQCSKKKLQECSRNDIKKSIHHLRKMSISTHIKQQEDTNLEVKNSWGGIRDIEFTVQALQLFNYVEHRERETTIDALERMRKLNVLHKEETKILIAHYLFLRRVEHFLQIYEDKQLHAIPKNNTSVTRRLAWLLMQEPEEDVFLKKLYDIKQEIHEWYKKIVVENVDENV